MYPFSQILELGWLFISSISDGRWRPRAHLSLTANSLLKEYPHPHQDLLYSIFFKKVTKSTDVNVKNFYGMFLFVCSVSFH